MSLTTGDNVEASHFVLETTAGEALSANDAVYIDASDGKAYQCDADDLSKIGFVGFVEEAAALNDAVNVKCHGIKDGFTGLTIGAIYYLSGTAGEVTATKPTNYKVIGRAISATTIRIATELTRRVRVYTSNATWTKPGGLSHVEVEVVGAGAGGGGADIDGGSGTCGPGGPSGGYSRKLIVAGDLSATESVTVGAAGTAGTTASTPTEGGAGGNSSFGSHATANGGGATNAGNIVEGGSASSGDVNISGRPAPYTEEDGTASHLTFVKGADSQLGVGGFYDDFTNAAKIAPSGYGAGGYGGYRGGAYNLDPSAGGGGVVIVTEYY